MLAVGVAGFTAAVAFGLLYASQAASQSKSIDLAVYAPIGVAQTPTGTHSVAWVLDSTNRRVVMCSQRLNDSAARIECRSGALPTD
jgi:hypothetical protein